MGYLHEAWKNTPSTVTTQTNARKAARAEKVLVLALATSHFGDGIEVCGLRSSWPLEGRVDGWRVHAKGASNKTLGFVASFADRLEAWSVSSLEEKPLVRLGEVAKVA